MADSARRSSPSAGNGKKRKAFPEAAPSEAREHVESSIKNGALDGGTTTAVDSSKRPSLPADEAPPLPDEQPPPLPGEQAPPLPTGPPPGQSNKTAPEDDGWQPVWEESSQTYYFYNRLTGASQWENPRVPEAPTQHAPGTAAPAPSVSVAPGTAQPQDTDLHPAVMGGYNPAIHGSYDPNADYAQVYTASSDPAIDPASAYQGAPGQPSSDDYAATATFNRFTGRFQNQEITPENYNDENKSKRQMNAFFDVDRAANSHDGKSLKAERSGKKISKKELKEFQQKRHAKKEQKRRAWLQD